MSNFLVQILAKSVEKDLAHSTEKNWLDSLVKNPMIKGMLKSYRKDIAGGLANGEQDLIKLLESYELQPGETQIAPIIDIDLDSSGNKEIRLILAAFEGSVLTRVISDIPLRTFLINWLEQKLK